MQALHFPEQKSRQRFYYNNYHGTTKEDMPCNDFDDVISEQNIGDFQWFELSITQSEALVIVLYKPPTKRQKTHMSVILSVHILFFLPQTVPTAKVLVILYLYQLGGRIDQILSILNVNKIGIAINTNLHINKKVTV